MYRKFNTTEYFFLRLFNIFIAVNLVLQSFLPTLLIFSPFKAVPVIAADAVDPGSGAGGEPPPEPPPPPSWTEEAIISTTPDQPPETSAPPPTTQNDWECGSGFGTCTGGTCVNHSCVYPTQTSTQTPCDPDNPASICYVPPQPSSGSTCSSYQGTACTCSRLNYEGCEITCSGSCSGGTYKQPVCDPDNPYSSCYQAPYVPPTTQAPATGPTDPQNPYNQPTYNTPSTSPTSSGYGCGGFVSANCLCATNTYGTSVCNNGNISCTNCKYIPPPTATPKPSQAPTSTNTNPSTNTTSSNVTGWQCDGNTAVFYVFGYPSITNSCNSNQTCKSGSCVNNTTTSAPSVPTAPRPPTPSITTTPTSNTTTTAPKPTTSTPTAPTTTTTTTSSTATTTTKPYDPNQCLKDLSQIDIGCDPGDQAYNTCIKNGGSNTACTSVAVTAYNKWASNPDKNAEEAALLKEFQEVNILRTSDPKTYQNLIALYQNGQVSRDAVLGRATNSPTSTACAGNSVVQDFSGYKEVAMDCSSVGATCQQKDKTFSCVPTSAQTAALAASQNSLALQESLLRAEYKSNANYYILEIDCDVRTGKLVERYLDRDGKPLGPDLHRPGVSSSYNCANDKSYQNNQIYARFETIDSNNFDLTCNGGVLVTYNKISGQIVGAKACPSNSICDGNGCRLMTLSERKDTANINRLAYVAPDVIGNITRCINTATVGVYSPTGKLLRSSRCFSSQICQSDGCETPSKLAQLNYSVAAQTVCQSGILYTKAINGSVIGGSRCQYGCVNGDDSCAPIPEFLANANRYTCQGNTVIVTIPGGKPEYVEDCIGGQTCSGGKCITPNIGTKYVGKTCSGGKVSAVYDVVSNTTGQVKTETTEVETCASGYCNLGNTGCSPSANTDPDGFNPKLKQLAVDIGMTGIDVGSSSKTVTKQIGGSGSDRLGTKDLSYNASNLLALQRILDELGIPPDTDPDTLDLKTKIKLQAAISLASPNVDKQSAARYFGCVIGDNACIIATSNKYGTPSDPDGFNPDLKAYATKLGFNLSTRTVGGSLGIDKQINGLQDFRDILAQLGIPPSADPEVLPARLKFALDQKITDTHSISGFTRGILAPLSALPIIGQFTPLQTIHTATIADEARLNLQAKYGNCSTLGSLNYGADLVGCTPSNYNDTINKAVKSGFTGFGKVQMTNQDLADVDKYLNVVYPIKKDRTSREGITAAEVEKIGTAKDTALRAAGISEEKQQKIEKFLGILTDYGKVVALSDENQIYEEKISDVHTGFITDVAVLGSLGLLSEAKPILGSVFKGISESKIAIVAGRYVNDLKVATGIGGRVSEDIVSLGKSEFVIAQRVSNQEILIAGRQAELKAAQRELENLRLDPNLSGNITDATIKNAQQKADSLARDLAAQQKVLTNLQSDLATIQRATSPLGPQTPTLVTKVDDALTVQRRQIEAIYLEKGAVNDAGAQGIAVIEADKAAALAKLDELSVRAREIAADRQSQNPLLQKINDLLGRNDPQKIIVQAEKDVVAQVAKEAEIAANAAKNTVPAVDRDMAFYEKQVADAQKAFDEATAKLNKNLETTLPTGPENEAARLVRDNLAKEQSLAGKNLLQAENNLEAVRPLTTGSAPVAQTPKQSWADWFKEKLGLNKPVVEETGTIGVGPKANTNALDAALRPTTKTAEVVVAPKVTKEIPFSQAIADSQRLGMKTQLLDVQPIDEVLSDTLKQVKAGKVQMAVVKDTETLLGETKTLAQSGGSVGEKAAALQEKVNQELELAMASEKNVGLQPPVLRQHLASSLANGEGEQTVVAIAMQSGDNVVGLAKLNAIAERLGDVAIDAQNAAVERVARLDGRTIIIGTDYKVILVGGKDITPEMVQRWVAQAEQDVNKAVRNYLAKLDPSGELVTKLGTGEIKLRAGMASTSFSVKTADPAIQVLEAQFNAGVAARMENGAVGVWSRDLENAYRALPIEQMAAKSDFYVGIGAEELETTAFNYVEAGKNLDAAFAVLKNPTATPSEISAAISRIEEIHQELRTGIARTIKDPNLAASEWHRATVVSTLKEGDTYVFLDKVGFGEIQNQNVLGLTKQYASGQITKDVFVQSLGRAPDLELAQTAENIIKVVEENIDRLNISAAEKDVMKKALRDGWINRGGDELKMYLPKELVDNNPNILLDIQGAGGGQKAIRVGAAVHIEGTEGLNDAFVTTLNKANEALKWSKNNNNVVVNFTENDILQEISPPPQNFFERLNDTINRLFTGGQTGELGLRTNTQVAAPQGYWETLRGKISPAETEVVGSKVFTNSANTKPAFIIQADGTIVDNRSIWDKLGDTFLGRKPQISVSDVGEIQTAVAQGETIVRLENGGLVKLGTTDKVTVTFENIGKDFGGEVYYTPKNVGGYQTTTDDVLKETLAKQLGIPKENINLADFQGSVVKHLDGDYVIGPISPNGSVDLYPARFGKADGFELFTKEVGPEGKYASDLRPTSVKPETGKIELSGTPCVTAFENSLWNKVFGVVYAAGPCGQVVFGQPLEGDGYFSPTSSLNLSVKEKELQYGGQTFRRSVDNTLQIKKGEVFRDVHDGEVFKLFDRETGVKSLGSNGNIIFGEPISSTQLQRLELLVKNADQRLIENGNEIDRVTRLLEQSKVRLKQGNEISLVTDIGVYEGRLKKLRAQDSVLEAEWGMAGKNLDDYKRGLSYQPSSPLQPQVAVPDEPSLINDLIGWLRRKFSSSSSGGPCNLSSLKSSPWDVFAGDCLVVFPQMNKSVKAGSEVFGGSGAKVTVSEAGVIEVGGTPLKSGQIIPDGSGKFVVLKDGAKIGDNIILQFEESLPDRVMLVDALNQRLAFVKSTDPTIRIAEDLKDAYIKAISEGDGAGAEAIRKQMLQNIESELKVRNGAIRDLDAAMVDGAPGKAALRKGIDERITLLEQRRADLQLFENQTDALAGLPCPLPIVSAFSLIKPVYASKPCGRYTASEIAYNSAQTQLNKDRSLSLNLTKLAVLATFGVVGTGAFIYVSQEYDIDVAAETARVNALYNLMTSPEYEKYRNNVTSKDINEAAAWRDMWLSPANPQLCYGLQSMTNSEKTLPFLGCYEKMARWEAAKAAALDVDLSFINQLPADDPNRIAIQSTSGTKLKIVPVKDIEKVTPTPQPSVTAVPTKVVCPPVPVKPKKTNKPATDKVACDKWISEVNSFPPSCLKPALSCP